MSKRPMSAKEYREELAHFKLTQPRAGWLFGGKSKATGRLWPAKGAPFHVALLIAIMHAYGITPDDIEELGEPYRSKKK